MLNMLKKNIIKISFHLFFFFFLIFYNINNIEASYCEYNSNVYSNEDGKMEGIDIKFRVDFDEDSFSWKWSNYDGSITKDNERNFYPTGGGTLWQKSFSEINRPAISFATNCPTATPSVAYPAFMADIDA